MAAMFFANFWALRQLQDPVTCTILQIGGLKLQKGSTSPKFNLLFFLSFLLSFGGVEDLEEYPHEIKIQKIMKKAAIGEKYPKAPKLQNHPTSTAGERA